MLSQIPCCAANVAALLLVVGLAAPVTDAEEAPAAVFAGLGGGTLGISGELGYGFAGERLRVRLAFNTLSTDADEEVEGLPLKLAVELESVAGLVDYSPFAGRFYLSGGLVVNNNVISVRNQPGVSYQIGGSTYSAADVGDLTGKVSFDDLVPYAGIGWQFNLGARGALALDLGALFQGSARVQLQATGLAAGLPAFQQDLEQARQDTENDLKEYEIYPVAQLSLRLRFN